MKNTSNSGRPSLKNDQEPKNSLIWAAAVFSVFTSPPLHLSDSIPGWWGFAKFVDYHNQVCFHYSMTCLKKNIYIYMASHHFYQTHALPICFKIQDAYSIETLLLFPLRLWWASYNDPKRQEVKYNNYMYSPMMTFTAAKAINSLSWSFKRTLLLCLSVSFHLEGIFFS